MSTLRETNAKYEALKPHQREEIDRRIQMWEQATTLPRKDPRYVEQRVAAWEAIIDLVRIGQ